MHGLGCLEPLWWAAAVSPPNIFI
eukprot:COSAG02_NODE_65374_length_258_cov_0.647799_1_plen_23_part_01